MSSPDQPGPIVAQPYARRWLERDLPWLVEREVVPPEIAARIRSAYEHSERVAVPRWGTVLLAVLGAVLVVGGLILLVAHNWRDLSRPLRTVLAIAPLGVTSLLGTWALATQRRAAWREALGAAQALATGLALALVSQTYHLGGTVDEFLRVWSLLTWPLVYLLNAAVPFLIFLGTLIGWTAGVREGSVERLMALGGLLLLAPHVWGELRDRRRHPRTLLLMWGVALALPGLYWIALSDFGAMYRAVDLWLLGLFATMYVLGTRWWPSSEGVRLAPLRVVGWLGAVALALTFSFQDTLPDLDVEWSARNWLGALLLWAPVGTALVLGVEASRRTGREGAAMALLPLVALAVRGLGAAHDPLATALLYTAALVIVGVVELVISVQRRQLGRANAAMALLAMVIIARFFDVELSYLWRGCAFIGAGLVILMVNLRWARRESQR